MHLSMPLEVVMPIVKKLTKEDYEKRDELQKMLATIKKEFTQSTVISCLVGQMALIIEEVSIWFFYDTCSIPTPNMQPDCILSVNLQFDKIQPEKLSSQ